jgi:dynein assembly factor 6, axonemal
MNFGLDEIDALRKLTGAVDDEEDDDGHIYGSALNPGTLHSKSKENKEIAKPNAEVVVKTFNRDAKGGAPEDTIAMAREALKKAQPKN